MSVCWNNFFCTKNRWFVFFSFSLAVGHSSLGRKFPLWNELMVWINQFGVRSTNLPVLFGSGTETLPWLGSKKCSFTGLWQSMKQRVELIWWFIFDAQVHDFFLGWSSHTPTLPSRPSKFSWILHASIGLLVSLKAFRLEKSAKLAFPVGGSESSTSAAPEHQHDGARSNDLKLVAFTAQCHTTQEMGVMYLCPLC